MAPGSAVENCRVLSANDQELPMSCWKRSTILEQVTKRQMESWVRHTQCGAWTADRELLTVHCERSRILGECGLLYISDRELWTTYHERSRILEPFTERQMESGVSRLECDTRTDGWEFSISCCERSRIVENLPHMIGNCRSNHETLDGVMREVRGTWAGIADRELWTTSRNWSTILALPVERFEISGQLIGNGRKSLVRFGGTGKKEKPVKVIACKCSRRKNTTLNRRGTNSWKMRMGEQVLTRKNCFHVDQ